jgi:hypothetical protein
LGFDEITEQLQVFNLHEADVIKQN